MNLSRIVLLIVCSLSALHAQQSPLDLPSLDKPPTLSLPPPKIVPLPTDASAPGTMAPVTPPPANPPALPPPVVKGGSTSSTSTNGQFIIHGADLQTRSWFNRFCETLASDLQRLMRDPQSWNIPIVLSLRTGNDMSLTEPSVKAVVSELDTGGFQLQLNVQLRPDLNTNDLRRELIVTLLAERVLRGHEKLTTTRSRILPEWLLVGATEALRYKERSRPSALFAAVFKTGKIYDIEEILEAAPGKLDALSRAIYETSSCALVLALLDQNEGSLRMAKFLNSLATETRGDRELINEWFPALAQSKTSLDKWWSLQMANMARPSVFESLDPVESIKALEDALTLRFQTEVEVTSSTPSKVVAEEEVVEDRPGFFSRLFKRSSDNDEPANAKPKTEEKEKPKVEDKPKEPAKPEPKPEVKPEPKPAAKPKTDDKPEEAKRPGLFQRLFSSEANKDEKKEPEKKPEKPKEKPAPAPKKDDKAEEKKTALNASPFLRMAADLAFPAATFVMDAHAWLDQPTAHYAILGFGKKKDANAEGETKSKKDEAKPADTKKTKPEPAKKEEPKKPEPKKEEPKKKEPAKPEQTAAPAPKSTVRTRKVATSVPIEDYAKVLKRSDAKEVFANTAQSLASLNQRVHPLFRPLISDYVKLLADLADGKTKNAEARLQELKAQRTQIGAQARAAQDFVDVYETNKNSKWSGLFDDFLRVPETVREELPKRVDPLSRLLDEAEEKAR